MPDMQRLSIIVASRDGARFYALVPQVRAAGLLSFLADARADDRLLVY